MRRPEKLSEISVEVDIEGGTEYSQLHSFSSDISCTNNFYSNPPTFLISQSASSRMFPLHSLQFSIMARLYEDEFVLLTPTKLVLKHFRFPNKKCKIINVDLIAILWFEAQETCRSKEIKTWGKTKSHTYWALDVKRCLPGSHRFNVVIDVGQSLRFGFSVENGVRFMENMRDILDYHVIVVDKINI